MKTGACVGAVLLMLVLGVMCSAMAQSAGPAAAAGDAKEFLGTWSGTWEGQGSTGGFELVLEQGADGAAGGRVSVTGEPQYQATLKTVAFDKNKMSASYDFPPDDHLEVALAATFEGGKARGTWSVHEKGGGSQVAAGTWSVTKQ